MINEAPMGLLFFGQKGKMYTGIVNELLTKLRRTIILCRQKFLKEALVVTLEHLPNN